MTGLLPVSAVLPVVVLQAQPAVVGPGAVTAAEPVIHDTGTPSRAALQRQLPNVDVFANPARGPAAATAGLDPSVTLSPAARALSALLDTPDSPAAKITGTQPLWPLLRQVPTASVAPMMAATLALTVDQSGLFYESHLQQFAAGSRTLAQLAQEPQARLAAAGATPTSQSAGSLEITAGLSARGDAALGQGADVFKGLPNLDGPENLDSSAKALNAQAASLPDTPRNQAMAPAGVHADAVALVRQQLELLAQPVFRWAGEAWPGTPMDWDIHQAPEDRSAPGDAPPRQWHTRLAVSLPGLKDVEMRLSLVEGTLQLQLAASDTATVSLLGSQHHELPARFAALGLQLKEVRVGALQAGPVASGSAGAGSPAWPG